MCKRIVSYKDDFEYDFDEIYRYIYNNSPLNAQKFANEL